MPEMHQTTDCNELTRALFQALNALTEAMEKRDPYTVHHQIGVSGLGRTIAQVMEMDVDAVECVRVAGSLHDIGKIGIPMEILTKPGRLSDAEMALVRTHVAQGGDILRGVDFPWPVQDALMQHHERRNGSGYPNGLGKDDLLIEGQILAVADVVHAMAEDRPYRKGLGVDAALAEIERGRDEMYHPDAVDACTKIMRDRPEMLDSDFWHRVRT